jgi:hypothetical protein
MQNFNITASDEFTEIIEQKLYSSLENSSDIQRLIVKISQKKFADKYETESRFDQILEELRQDRAENRRLWDESISGGMKVRNNGRKITENGKKRIKNFMKFSPRIVLSIRNSIKNLKALSEHWGQDGELRQNLLFVTH